MESVVPNIAREELDELAASFAGSWSVNGGFSAPELQFSQDWLYETEDFADTAPVALDLWTDFSVMDAVFEDLGVYESADLPVRIVRLLLKLVTGQSWHQPSPSEPINTLF